MNMTEADPCPLCTDTRRDPEVICVVATPSDLLAIDRGGHFRGRYHVLHGLLSPLEGIGPDDIKIPKLIERLRDGRVKEIIAATNPSVNGEATASYLHRVVAPLGVAVSRIALGVPMGSDIEFADKVTLGRAIAGRRPL